MRPTRLSLLVACALASVPGVRAQPAEPFTLQLDPQLSEERARARDNRPAFARGDRIDGRTDRETTLIGNAELRRPGNTIQADRITYYEDDDQVIAVGNVRVIRDGNLFTGPELALQLDANEGFFTSPSYLLPALGGRGRADRVEFLGSNRLRLFGATYTTCRPDRPDWYIQAEQITIDELDQVGQGRSGRLVFRGRATPSIPAFSFPLGNERKTGFLTPSFWITSRAGPELLAPFYWNIAPNRDLTLYPRLFLTRGVQLGGELRYLEPRAFGNTRFEVLPGDRNPTGQEPGTTRWLYGIDHNFRDLAGWNGRLVARRVSDDTYFTDFGRSLLAASERSLPIELSAFRGLPGGWTVFAGATRWQNILDARLAPPYDRLPSLQALNEQRDLGGFDISSRMEAVQFRRDLAPSPGGWRFIGSSSVSYPITRPGWFVIPRASLHATQYSLDTNPATPGLAASPENPTSLTRVLPTLSVDAGLIFERPFQRAGQQWTQTLEPRLFYARTPFRDQSRFPVFDSGVASFNFAQLFSENRFVGGDRIADVNQITTAAVSRFVDPQGKEILRLAAGQRLSFTEQRVSLPGLPPPSDRRSDVLLAASANLGEASFADVGIQYGVRDGDFPRINLAWRYWPQPRRLLNFSYRYARDFAINQVDLSWRWPIGDQWSTMGRVNYSFSQSIDPITRAQLNPGLIDSVLGVEYLGDCYVVRFALQRYVTLIGTAAGTARPNNVLFVQLELTGVGRVGNDLSSILQRSIPGYRFNAQRPESPSQFFGYQ